MANLCYLLFVVFFVGSATIKALILDFEPKPPIGSKSTSSNLIWYSQTKQDDIDLWSNATNQYLRVYYRPSDNIYQCDYKSPVRPGRICDQDIRNIYPCSYENLFGYNKGQPCVFIVLNPSELLGFSPSPYEDDIPKEMPNDLKNYITQQKNLTAPLNSLWLSCEGETSADKENIGPIQYYPGRGYPGYNFPITTMEGFRSPIIAIQFQKPTTGLAISVICKAWAKNSHPDVENNISVVKFELLVDYI